MTEEQKPKRGRPRIHANRQQAWKDRTGYEQSDDRKAYKREWAKQKRRIKVTNKEIKMNYPYASKIKVTLNIGFVGAEHEDVICPRTDSTYTQEEWDALSEDAREDWVNSSADDWSRDYITLEYAVVKP